MPILLASIDEKLGGSAERDGREGGCLSDWIVSMLLCGIATSTIYTYIYIYIYIFTDSALLARSVIKLQCPSVRPSGCFSVHSPSGFFQGLSLANTGHMITSQASHRIAPPHMIIVAEEL